MKPLLGRLGPSIGIGTGTTPSLNLPIPRNTPLFKPLVLHSFAIMPSTSKSSPPQTRSSHTSHNEDQSQSHMKHATSCTEHWEDPTHLERNQTLYREFLEEERRARGEKEGGGMGKGEKKRGQGANMVDARKKIKSSKGEGEGEGGMDLDG